METQEMETQTKSSRIPSLLFIYDAHTKLYPNVIVDITDKDAHNRLNTKANHVAWLAGSLLFHRAGLGKMFGTEIKTEADELFKDYQGLKENAVYPSLESYKAEWERISPIAREVLANATDEKLDSIFDMPEMKLPYFDLTAYHIHREAYVIGQIALWRRLLGYEAMKYPGM